MSNDLANENALFGRHHFLVRRLHSLSGIVPIGVFLCVHLLTNASVLAPGDPGAEFQKAVEKIHALGPMLIPVEIVGIFIPLLFHSVLGVLIVFTADSNVQHYPYGGNIRYTLQRATGMIAGVFILYHLWQMHWMGKPLGGGAFELHEAGGAASAAVTTARAIQSSWWVTPIYAIGIVATVYHFANGVWTSLITWGITIKPRTQRVAGYVCAVLGLVLTLAGLGALRGFKTFDTGSDAPATSAALDVDGHDTTHE